MEGFFLYLLIFGMILIYTVLAFAVYKHFILDHNPDAILHFCETKDSVTGNFVLLLPIDEVRKKKTIIVEIQNSVLETSLEDVIDSVE